ncbi:MAG: preprotein translocase subunit YajC [Actinomycetota bacterium]
MEQVIPFVLIAVFGYVALVWPQQRRNKQHRELLASISEGDEIVLNSGIHGFVQAIEPTVVWLEVADSVELKVSRSAIASKIEVPVDAESEDS